MRLLHAPWPQLAADTLPRPAGFPRQALCSDFAEQSPTQRPRCRECDQHAHLSFLAVRVSSKRMMARSATSASLSGAPAVSVAYTTCLTLLPGFAETREEQPSGLSCKVREGHLGSFCLRRSGRSRQRVVLLLPLLFH
jgi:hypothetical protein